jgi:hypothetical protein
MFAALTVVCFEDAFLFRGWVDKLNPGLLLDLLGREL